jgi:lipopolysaccharide export LptBFGC system permease protein LptF
MIADRVVLGRLAPRVVAWLAVVVGLYALADLADALARPVPWSSWPLRLPAMVFQGMPVALAAAAAHTVSALRRSGEWTALEAGGLGTGRRLRAVVLVIAIAAAGSWMVGDWVAPAAAREYRAVGGGAPPGAVVLPLPAADWARRGGELVRSGRAPMRVSFAGTGAPRIEARGSSAAPIELPPASDLPRAELLSRARRAGDALPYVLEASFRPLVASSALLVPLLVLSFVAPRPCGPRAAALATVLGCLGAFAVIAGAHSLAAAGAARPQTSAMVAALALAAAAIAIGVCRTVSGRRC